MQEFLSFISFCSCMRLKRRTGNYRQNPMQAKRQIFFFCLWFTCVILLILMGFPYFSHTQHPVNRVVQSTWAPRVRNVLSNIASVDDLAAVMQRTYLANTETEAAAVRHIADVYSVETATALQRIPDAFKQKAAAMFPALSPSEDTVLRALEQQAVITVRNIHSKEMTFFNSIRRFRPNAEQPLSDADESAIQALYTTGATPDQCDFCSVSRTSEEVFGRLHSKHAYAASNIAKVSKWHTCIVARRHNPIAYTAEEIEDMVLTSWRWSDEVNKRDARYKHANIICDIGKRASASQAHLHFQVVMTQEQQFTGFSRLIEAASRFEAVHQRSYWSALIEAHAAAGLMLKMESAYILAYLSPSKEKEIFVIDMKRSASFARAVAFVLCTLRDYGQSRSMSMSMVTPNPAMVGDDTPALFRVIDRGNPLDPRGDTGAFEYFGSPYVGTDPYRVMTWLSEAMANRKAGN